MRTVNFGGEKETVWERSDFPKDKIKAILGTPEVDCGVDAVGFEARGCGRNAAVEQPVRSHGGFFA